MCLVRAQKGPDTPNQSVVSRLQTLHRLVEKVAMWDSPPETIAIHVPSSYLT